VLEVNGLVALMGRAELLEAYTRLGLPEGVLGKIYATLQAGMKSRMW
jgi:hypothetical protein